MPHIWNAMQNLSMKKFIAIIALVLALLAVGQAQDIGEEYTTLAPDEDENTEEELPPPSDLDLYIPLRPPRLPGIANPFGPQKPPNLFGNIFGQQKFNEGGPQFGPLRRPEGQQQPQGFQQRPFGFGISPRLETLGALNYPFAATQFDRFYVNNKFQPGYDYGNVRQQQQQGPAAYLDNRSFQQQQKPFGLLINPFGLGQHNKPFEGFGQGQQNVYGYEYGRYPFYSA